MRVIVSSRSRSSGLADPMRLAHHEDASARHAKNSAMNPTADAI